MKYQKNSLGFAAVEGILIAVILAAIGLVGWKVYSTKNSTDEINSNTAAVLQQPASSTADVPSINKTSDLDKAEQALNQYDSTPQDNSDSGQLDQQLSTF
ncbi:MAG TPA: hypothetical protein VLG25_00025 [Patescibacteria group bacterium]|nr:hypothetical protein [Patescibacteria group bacterium]